MAKLLREIVSIKQATQAMKASDKIVQSYDKDLDEGIVRSVKRYFMQNRIKAKLSDKLDDKQRKLTPRYNMLSAKVDRLRNVSGDGGRESSRAKQYYDDKDKFQPVLDRVTSL